MLLKRAASKLTLTEMSTTPGGEDVNEDRAVFALPPLSCLVQRPGIAVNELVTHSLSPGGL